MVLLRWLLDPWMGEHWATVTLYGAVAAAVWYGGYRPALVAAVLGYLACNYLFMEPRGQIALRHSYSYIGLALYLFTCAIIIAFGEALRAAQRRADQQREFLRVTFSSMGDAVIVTDAGGRVASLNPVAAALTGWAQEEAAGRPLEEVFRIVNEQTRHPVENPVKKVLAEGKVVGLADHTTLIANDGKERPVDDSAAPIKDAQGHVLGAVLIFRDITARRRAEAARDRAEQHLHIVTDAMSAPVTRCSRDLRYLWVSKPYADFIGRPRGEIIGRPIRDVLGEEVFRQLRPRFEQVLSGRKVSYEEEVDYPGVGRRWVNATYTPTVGATGVPDGWVAVVLDVTEQKRAVEQLRRAEEQVRSVVNTVLDGIITIDEGGTVETFNPAAEKLFGYKAEEVVGRNVKLLMPEPYHGGHDGYLADYRRTGRAKVIGVGREVEGRRKDGSTFPMDLAVGESRPGERRYFTGVVRDVTERKRIEEALRFSEQQARAFLDNSAIIAWLKDEQGRNVFLSENYVRRFGLADWKGKTDFELWPHDVAEQYRRNDLVVLGRDRPLECVEEARTPNGEVSTWLNSKFWFQDASGRKYVGGVGVDITERRRAEEALRQADRRKDEFLATLAHELRNPLAPLRNAVELLRRGEGQADLSEKARGMMERQLAVMVRLVDDLLDISRIARGKLQLRKERVDLASVVHSAVEAARPSIEAQAHELTVTLPPQPVYLDADSVRLAQVFLNLLTNAAKYTEKGGHIWLTAERQGGEVVASVRDTGIGVAAEHLPHLFEMFSQVAPALERSQGGLGIGLALVRGLVELHGGSVEARSGGPGLGSEFLVRLPVVGAPAEAPREPTGDGEKVGGARTCRILVVDDNRDAADSLALMLRLKGHDIQTAHDGLEAIQAAAAFRPEVVLLDIGLPKMNGYEAAQYIRAQPWGGHMALIAVTGWGQEEDKRRSLEAGFDHHLTKPVDPAALEKLLALIAPVGRQ
jgi:PAS domain S-box-containing protein